MSAYYYALFRALFHTSHELTNLILRITLIVGFIINPTFQIGSMVKIQRMEGKLRLNIKWVLEQWSLWKRKSL